MFRLERRWRNTWSLTERQNEAPREEGRAGKYYKLLWQPGIIIDQIWSQTGRNVWIILVKIILKKHLLGWMISEKLLKITLLWGKHLISPDCYSDQFISKLLYTNINILWKNTFLATTGKLLFMTDIYLTPIQVVIIMR